MASETEIANVALRLVGQQPIVDRTDGTSTANTVDDLFDEVRDDLLRSHAWNFATKRVKLAQSVTTPAFEFDYAYPLPADWVRTISVHNNDAGYGTVLHRMELVGTQRCIVASADDIYLRYVYKVTDPNLMAADFRRALSVSLARDLAVAIASSNTLQDRLAAQAQRTISRAKSSDAIGASPEMRPRGSWVSARGGYNSNRNFTD